MRLEFGSYAQVFEDSDPTNTPGKRSLAAIALGPTCNSQGDFYFTSLATAGAHISRHHWAHLPLPDTAIARVEALALHEVRPLIQDRDYEPFDPTELYDTDPHLFVPAPPAQGAEHDTQDLAPIDLAPIPKVDLDDDDLNLDFDNIIQDVPPSQDDDDHLPEEQGAPAITREDAPPIDEDQGAPHGYILRKKVHTTDRDTFRNAIDTPHDTKSYFAPTQLLQESAPASEPSNKIIGTKRFAFNYVMTQMATTCTQMSKRASLRKHGQAAEASLMSEFSKLEALNVYESLDPQKLTRHQKKTTLRAINLIKEKRNGKLKGRTCADGRSQRNLYDKSQTASPTVSTNVLMLTIIIEAFEARDVATAYVAGAYLKAFMDDFVMMKFVGTSVKLLCDFNPDHRKFVTTENDIEVLNVRLIKALYGCVKSALLWYFLLTTNLQDMGFELNPYNPCVANSMIDGKQCTIAWYDDDT